MSYAETVYAQMLQMQMSAAKEAWLEAEQKKQFDAERKAREFDQFQGVMDWMLRAQQEKHKEEMDIAKMVGSGEGLSGKPSGMSFGGDAGQMQQAARFQSMGEMEAAVNAALRKQQEERDWWIKRYGPGGLAPRAKIETAEEMTEVKVKEEDALRPGKVETSLQRAKATAPYRNIPAPPRPMSESQSVVLNRDAVARQLKSVEEYLDGQEKQAKDLRMPVKKEIKTAREKLATLANSVWAEFGQNQGYDPMKLQAELQDIYNMLGVGGRPVVGGPPESGGGSLNRRLMLRDAVKQDLGVGQ